MKIIDLSQELKENTYPGRGIIVGKSQDGKMCGLRLLYNGQER